VKLSVVSRAVVRKLIFAPMKSSPATLDLYRGWKRVSVLGLDGFKSANGAWWPHTSLLTVLLQSQKRPSPHPSSFFLLIHGALDKRTFCHCCNRVLPFAHFRCGSKPSFSFMLHVHKIPVISECVRELDTSEKILAFASSQWRCSN